MEEKLKILHEALQILVKPCGKGDEADLDTVLSRNIELALGKLGAKDLSTLQCLVELKADVNQSSGIRWQFACLCLAILLDVTDILLKDAESQKKSLTEAAPPDALSVQQQKTIQTACQFVICFGLLPYLLPGVGIPLERRSGFASLVQGALEKGVGELQKYERLVFVTRVFHHCLRQPTLAALILTRHLGDILAALIQLAFAPLKKPESTASTPTDSNAPEGAAGANKSTPEGSSRSGFVMTEQLWLKLQNDKAEFRTALQGLLGRVYQPMAVRELMLLQGTPASDSTNKAHAPVWLKKICVSLLSERLVRPNGVVAVVQAVMDAGGSSCSEGDWSRCEAVARLIATPPQQGMTSDQYYSIICPQILNLLNADDSQVSRLYVRTAVACVRIISDFSHLAAKRHVFDVIMEPLLKCCESDDDDKSTGAKPHLPSVPTVIVGDHVLSTCILSLHRLFVTGTEPFCLHLMKLTPVIHVLFELYCFVRFTILHLKHPVEELLIYFLRHCDTEHRQHVLEFWAFGNVAEAEAGKEAVRGIRRCQPEISFVPGDGGATVIWQSPSSEEENSCFVSDSPRSVCLVELLCDTNSDACSEFFLFLLQELTALLGHSDDSDGKGKKVGDNSSDGSRDVCEQELIRIEQEVDNSLKSLRRSLMVIRLLNLLSDQDHLQQSLLKSPVRAIEFVQATLERAASLCQSGQYKEAGFMEAESVTMAMGVMATLASQSNMGSREWDAMKGALEPLRLLVTLYPDNRVQSMAEELRIAIATHGAAKDPTLVGKAQPDVQQSSGKSSETGIINAEKEDVPSIYQQALSDIRDPLVPVRGHALLQLSKLVVAKDPEAMNDAEKLFTLMQDQLEDEDSYVYLMAIQGLAALGSVFPEKALQVLTEEFACFESVRAAPFKDKAPDARMKIGEVLVRFVRSLGDTASHYKVPLLNAFLASTTDPDILVRASALSNLGELCRLLRFSLGSIVHEVFTCLTSILKHDPAVEVKRASVLVVTLLLEGLGNDALKVLQDILRDLYRTLKLVEQQEEDPILLTHTQLALDELGGIARAGLFPETKLEKRIHVLDPIP